MACELANGRRVLDIACGEGYGSNLLANHASEVIGVDNDRLTIKHAKRKYRRANLRFTQGLCSAIPLEDGSIDLVVSFETMEHVREQEQFLNEVRRVLVSDGILIISSPDKVEYGLASAEPNPFHQKELNHAELEALLASRFKHRITGKQRLVVGSFAAPDADMPDLAVFRTFHGSVAIVESEPGLQRGLYSVAICSNSALPRVPFGLFEDYEQSADMWNLLGQHGTPAAIAARISDVLRLEQQFEQSRQELHAARQEVELLLQQGQRDARELLDLRWEVLSQRADWVRELEIRGSSSPKLQEAEERLEAAGSERNQLRGMLKALQAALEASRREAEAAKTALRNATSPAAVGEEGESDRGPIKRERRHRSADAWSERNAARPAQRKRKPKAPEA